MTATADYQSLREAMDHRMLAADPARVEALKAVLHRIGAPDRRVKMIHIAGTNGKGSTGAFIAQALRNQGFVVGHFASPAIKGELHQSQIDGVALGEGEFAALMIRILDAAELTPASFTDFEWDVLVTLVWFADHRCDWVVLEAGLGGATDATNAVAAPKLAVFTHIALDHTAILGPTVAAIAHNKAQIIKPGTQVVIAPQQAPAAKAVLQQVAVAHQTAGVIDAENVALTPQACGWQGSVAQLADGTQVVIRMLGDFQLANARTALAVGDWLVTQGVLTSRKPMLDALASVQLPGRLQVLSTRPPRVVVDAGHNPDALPQAMAYLRRLLAQAGQSGRLLMVAGFLKDKDTTRLAQAVASADAVWVTTPTHPSRALAGADLQALIPASRLAADVHAGLAAAQAVARPADVILVAGSFYLIGDLL